MRALAAPVRLERLVAGQLQLQRLTFISFLHQIAIGSALLTRAIKKGDPLPGHLLKLYNKI